MKRTLLHLALSIAVLSAAVPQAAHSQLRDHDRAHSAVRSGEVLPLRHILRTLRGRLPGRVLDAKLRQDPDSKRWRYDVKLINDSGTVANITVDGRTGRILTVR